MATASPATLPQATSRALRPTVVAAGVCATLAAGACLLAGWAPLGISIVTVFLFAGPHNWMEARYFVQRMPARWGPLRGFYSLAIGGAAALTAGSLALPSLTRFWQLDAGGWMTSLSIWNTSLVVWIVVLAHLRRRERAETAGRWPYLFAAGWLLVSAAWLFPLGWRLALVYLHPLVALWFLDRELARRNVAWRRGYRWSLALLPLLLAALWWRLWQAPHLPGDDLLSREIAAHAGHGILQGVSTHLLVSTHVFLEMLHYAVWMLAIPLIGFRVAPWRLDRIPLARKSGGWRRGVAAVLIVGAAVVVLLWAGFLADYPLTRDLYFNVAILHVLAEAPFLLRLL